MIAEDIKEQNWFTVGIEILVVIANYQERWPVDMDQSFNYSAGGKFIDFQYRAGLSVANDNTRPSKNSGSFFDNLYGKN